MNDYIEPLFWLAGGSFAIVVLLLSLMISQFLFGKPTLRWVQSAFPWAMRLFFLCFVCFAVYTMFILDLRDAAPF